MTLLLGTMLALLAPPVAPSFAAGPPVEIVEVDPFDRMIAADLDGQPGDELLVFTPPDRRGPAQALVMKWFDDGFSKTADGRLSDPGYEAGVADTDGDGKEEVIMLTEGGGVTTIRQDGDRIVEKVSSPLTDRLVTSFAVGRFDGQVMLVAAVDSSMAWNSDLGEDPAADALLFFRRSGDGWTRAFKTGFTQVGMSLDLMTAPWDERGDLLVAGNMPSDVSTSEVELYRVRSTAVERTARMRFATDTQSGLQNWFYAFRRGDVRLVITTAFYTSRQGEEDQVTDRTELRSFRDGRTQLLGQMPGQAVAVGELLGVGKLAVLAIQYPRAEGESPRLWLHRVADTAGR